jgi:hypothetical protein
MPCFDDLGMRGKFNNYLDNPPFALNPVEG